MSRLLCCPFDLEPVYYYATLSLGSVLIVVVMNAGN